MRSRRALIFLTIASAVLIAIPAASAIGQGLRGPSSDQHINAAVAIGSSFTYQGRLVDGGSAPTGAYDIRFVLFDAAVGGSQVPNSPILTRDDVAVAAGLFSVELDFGDGVFDGEARWIELAVKPGTSGNFTVLNPRQPVQPIPQAMYAQTAGNLVFPIESTGETESGALLTISQMDAGAAIAGVRGYDGATVGAAISGSNAGAGAALEGSSTYINGIGVSGEASGQAGTGGLFTGRTGVKAAGMDAFSTALEVDGAVKVSGSNRFAFVHSSSGGNTFHNISWINSSLSNGDPNAIVVVSPVLSAATPVPVTPVATVVATPTTPAGGLTGITAGFAVGVVYVPANGIGGAAIPEAAKGKWAIVRLDGQDIPAGMNFSVTVVKQ